MILKLLIGAYGALSLLAAVLQGKYKNIEWWSACILGLGGILTIATIFISGMMSVYCLIVGVVLIHISAVINGIKMHGQITKKHHITRFGVSGMLVVGQYIVVAAL